MTMITIEIGAMAKPLKEQLVDYGLSEKVLDRLERINHSITMLHIHGYIPTSQTEKCRKKLVKSIKSEIASRSLQ